MKYRLEVTARAQAEADEAYRRIAHDSPANAARWYNRLVDTIDTLKELPERCPVAPENEFFKQEIRQLLYGRYRILFEIQHDTVYVLHFRHGARDYLKPEAKAKEDDVHM